jgi:hypothetical protein
VRGPIDTRPAQAHNAKTGVIESIGGIMTELGKILQAASADERGHTAPLVPALVGAAGAIVLAIGAAADSDIAAIIGGIVLAVGLLATTLVYHTAIDYPIFRRLDDLEK